ncbi:hypothetical protein [Pseudomonas typographi]|uniref:Uncharacterized protein n=1 Tax=Pseudomonas typographi TaxID=2715964 RepID=A0ABR7YZH9_9PSED|nr:hypothetical protein [Pseudomonas typographi]MBD1553617.1 hypothetical protein [Pseudomonas typographi]MBD1586702.1 hypothetical protein [Pseudomonas typographi]MBD1598595.1 hypothetical protein [Pseudomonas typographi]
MSNVTEFADHTPHVALEAADGVHVIPVLLLQAVIRGQKPSSVLTEPVLQSIINAWLEKACS